MVKQSQRARAALSYKQVTVAVSDVSLFCEIS